MNDMQQFIITAQKMFNIRTRTRRKKETILEKNKFSNLLVPSAQRIRNLKTSIE